MKTEFDIYIAPDGEEFSLNDWYGTWLLSGDGFGMPPIDYKTTRGPFQHGETPIDFFLRPRVIQFQFRVQECTRARYYTLRNKTLNYLRPNRQLVNTFNAGVLRKILADGRKRDINVLVDEGPTFPFSNDSWDEWGSFNTLRFIAHDPTYFDPELEEISASASEATELVFPITFPITFGPTIINEDVVITYTGTWMSLPTIVITGPLGNPRVENLATGEFIELEYNVPAGKVVTIDLRYGVKTVTDDSGTNLVGTVTSDSDLVTFHIATDPEAAGGVNTIRFSGAGATEDTEIKLQYYTRYIGI